MRRYACFRCGLSETRLPFGSGAKGCCVRRANVSAAIERRRSVVILLAEVFPPTGDVGTLYLVIQCSQGKIPPPKKEIHGSTFCTSMKRCIAEVQEVFFGSQYC